MARTPALLLLLALVGCVTPEPAAPPPDLGRRAVAVVPAPPPAPPRPIVAEVEISGRIGRPKGNKGRVTIWAASAPCFAPGATALGETGGDNPEHWNLDLFLPPGTSIWTCAAISDGKDAFRYSGTAEHAPIISKGAGEVGYPEQIIRLKKGRVVTPPRSAAR
jgi:hypothetical protein